MPTFRPCFAARAAAALTVVWIGCSSVPVLAVSTVAIDPCNLLTAADAQGVLCVPVGVGDGTTVLCVYAPASGKGANLTVIASRTGSQATNRANFENARRHATASAASDIASVSGVGDAAYTSGKGHFLTFIKGDATVSLMIAVPGSAMDYRERLVAVAKAVAARL